MTITESSDNPLDPSLARTLAQKLHDGKLILFAGAGLSHLAIAKDGSDHRIPLWAGLTQVVAKRFDFKPEDFSDSPLDLFDAVVHAHSRGELEKTVTAALDDRDFELSSAHNTLVKLPWRKIVTTNYDALLSRLFDEAYPIDDETGYDRLSECKVIQLHGKLPHPHTLTRDDYRLWAIKNPRAAHALCSFIHDNTLLFVGYSLSDPHLDDTLALIRDWTKGREKRLYGLFWKIPQAKQVLLDQRDKITVASIDTAEQWQSAFCQIKTEFDRLAARASPTPLKVQDDPFSYDRAQYLQALRSRYGIANLQGLYIWGAGYARDDVKLDEIFVEPNLCEWQILPNLRNRDEEVPANILNDSEFSHARRRQEQLRESTRSEPALIALGRENRLCIIGAPGQGKSTLLHQYVLISAAAWRDDTSKHFPVYLRLSEWEQHTCGFADWSKQAISGLGEISSQALDNWLQNPVLWLLDGVDEIRDSYQRQALQDELLALLANRPQDRAVLATRPQGYPLGGFGAIWSDVELPPLNAIQSRTVLANWGVVLKRKEANLFFDAAAVDRELERQPGLRQIRGNALLLTLVVLFYKNNRRLPYDRWEYFDKAENALRDSWLAYRLPEAARNTPGDYLPVFLERLALYGMKQGIVSFPSTILKNVASTLLKERGYTGREIDEEIKRLLRSADDLIGVIAAQAPEHYGFLHLAFQEFLAARALVNRSDWCAEVIADYWDEPDWTEVWGFYAKGIGEDAVRWRDLFANIQANAHQLDQHLHRDKLVCLRLGGFCFGSLPPEWENLEAWALQGLDTDYRLSVLATLKDRERPLTREILSALLTQLEDKDRQIQAVAAAVLASQTSVPEVPAALFALLKNENAPQAAAIALAGHAGIPEVRTTLLAWLGDVNNDVRRSTILALAGQTEQLDVRAAFLASLKDKNQYVRMTAALALQDKSSVPEVRAALLMRLEDEDMFVRLAVALGLTDQTNEPEVWPALLARLEDNLLFVRQTVIAALANQVNVPEVRAALLAQLENKDDDSRHAVVEALASQAGKPSIRSELLMRLGDKNAYVRQAAAEALAGQANITEVRSALLAQLGDKSAHVRQAATAALTEQAAIVEVQMVLLERLEDKNVGVRQAAVEALANQAAVTKVRMALLERMKDKNAYVRQASAESLASQAAVRTVRAELLVLLEDKYWGVRLAATEALVSQIAVPKVRAALLALLEKKDAKYAAIWMAAAEALAGQTSDSDVRVALLARLRDKDEDVQQTAVKVLAGQAGNSEVRAALLGLLSDKNFNIREATALALTQAALQERRQHREQKVIRKERA